MSKQQDKKMEESKFKDVELISDGVTIPCHKLILALHSQYFRTIFSNPQLDSNQIKIMSFSPKTLNAVKTFIYTGNVKVTRKTIKNMLEAFTFFVISDRFGKLEEAMGPFIYDDKPMYICIRRDDDNKLDEYEKRIWEDYCHINSLIRCCSKIGHFWTDLDDDDDVSDDVSDDASDGAITSNDVSHSDDVSDDVSG